MVKKLRLLLCLWVGITLAAVDAFAAALTVAVESHKEIVTLSVKSTNPHKVFLLPSPNRLVIDVPAVGIRPELSLSSGYKGTLITRTRFGQFDPHTWRLVLDLNQLI